MVYKGVDRVLGFCYKGRKEVGMKNEGNFTEKNFRKGGLDGRKSA